MAPQGNADEVRPRKCAQPKPGSHGRKWRHGHRSWVKACEPTSSRDWTLAPESRSTRAHAGWPPIAAQWRAVEPACSPCAATSTAGAPGAESSSLSARLFPRTAARCIAVIPSASTAAAAPSPADPSTTSTIKALRSASLCSAARCSNVDCFRPARARASAGATRSSADRTAAWPYVAAVCAAVEPSSARLVGSTPLRTSAAMTSEGAPFLAASNSDDHPSP